MAETTNDQKFAATLARLDTKKKTMDEARLATLPSENQKDSAFFSEARARSKPFDQRGGGGTSDRADKATLTARLRSYSDPNSPLRQVLSGLKEDEAKAAAGAALDGLGKPAAGVNAPPVPAADATAPVGTPAIKSEDSGVRKNLNIEAPSSVVSDALTSFTSFGSAPFPAAGTNPPAPKNILGAAPTLPVPGVSPTGTSLTNTGAQASFFGKPMTDEEKAKQTAYSRLTMKA